MSTNQQDTAAETATQCDRPKCGHPTADAEPCNNPVIPIDGIDVCAVHFGG